MWWNQRKASSGSRSSRGSRGSHSSRGSHASGVSIRGSQPREIEFQFFIRQTETLYPPWWTREGMISWFHDLPDDTMWNCYICSYVLIALIWTVTRTEGIYFSILDVVYNISYAIHIFAIGYKIITELENTDITFWTVLGFLVDLGSFAHYVQGHNPDFKLGAYYARLQRPYKYLGSLNDYNLKGSILGTTLKYCYIFMVLRITWAYIWMHMHEVSKLERIIGDLVVASTKPEESVGSRFLSALYIINKMFIPIGPSEYPASDVERLCCLMIMTTGCLVVTGAAVASLSLIISLYMRPEETFRSRYRLIIKEMEDTKVPPALREKVETFYKMYWHKQRAVSETQLLPIFPPTLPATINMDIYFEATQRARILRELSYQLLSELAKHMETIHYIPGDAIIKRGSKKCKIIYITYGDVEMLTAEDDSTAILRMTRGSVLTPCGGAAAAAVGLSHVAVRAATFCTAHVLTAAELWRVVYKHSVTQDHAGPILAAFTDHVERVKRHYITKVPDTAFHKSSILQFNRNLMALKQMRDDAGNLLLASADVFLEIAGCYIMRNRPDVTLTDQSDEICLRPTFPCILQPSSSLLVAWNSFVAAIILIVCVTHPYYLVYQKNVTLTFRFFDYAVTAIFVLDHVVYLSTGANVEEGVPITFTQTSSQQMRSHWFVLDVVGTLPIFEFVGNGHFSGINKLLRLPKLFRVLKSIEESCVYRGHVLRFLSYTLLLLIACYLIAAMQQGFMCFQSGYCLVTNFTHRPFWEHKPLDEETVGSRLTFGLYWAISMINFAVHRETWSKDNWKTVIYTLVILEICVVLRIFMEAVYSATIMVTTALREDYGARIAMVKNFFKRNEVDPMLMKRFITYLQLCWHTDKAYRMTHKKHSTIFYDLPPHVYQDIVGRNRSKYILVLPFMRLVNKEELKNVSASAKLFYTSPNEIILNTGELTNEIYVIKQGICEILDPITHECIGHLSLPSYYTIRAITHVQVVSIPRKSLIKCLETPQIMQAIDYLKTRPEFFRLQTRLPSFIKYVELPPTPSIMHFRLPRKHEPDYEFLQPFTNLGFLSILRYVFPRYTIRPDGKYLLRYEWFRVICALCSAQLFPHYTYLVLQWPNLYYVSLFLDLSAWFDIIQRMMIGYFNEDGILVYHPASTSAYYMKGPFIADVFGCLALENLEASRVDVMSDKYHVTPTKQFLMLNRLIQLYRMPSAMMTLKQYIERRDILMVIQAIPLFVAMLNVLTCFMIFYSVKIMYSQDNEGNYEWTILPLNDKGGSWLYLFSDTFRFNMTATPWNLHIATYFWVVYECSTTGYGVFNPSNHELMKVLFIGMASSTMIITYYSVRIISIRANVNNSLAGFQHHMKDINVFMAKEKLDSELQKELRRYYEYNWEKMGGIDYRAILKLCDQITLRTDAILHIYGPTFAKCPLLAGADVSLLRTIGRSVRSVYFLRDMQIIQLNDMVTVMYFVDFGGVEVRVPTGEMFAVIRLPRGSVFGNLEGTAGQRSACNVVATGRLHLLMINALTFSSVTKDFPEVKQLMATSKSADKNYILGSEAAVKTRRNVSSGPPPRSKKSLIKYIYFQEGIVQTYLIVVCMSCLYLDLYNAGFQDNATWLLITLYTLDLAFFLKIFTQHALPLVVTNKSMKKLMMPIRTLYFKGEFRYDLISVIPIEVFSFIPGGWDTWLVFAWLRLNRMFRVEVCKVCKTNIQASIRKAENRASWMAFVRSAVTRIVKVTTLRHEDTTKNKKNVPKNMPTYVYFACLLATVQKCLRRRHESITVNLTITTVMAVFIWFTLFVHTTTSLWHFMAVIEDAIHPNSSWRYHDDGSSHCDNHYVCSLYFIFTTFAQNGVGDIMPKHRAEVLFVSILQILSTMVFMVYVGEFSNIIQYQSYRSFSFYSKYLELQEFLKNNRVSANLVTIVNKYTLHLWRETRGLQVPQFLKNAPLSLRLRIMSAIYLHHITRHHIFEECEPAFLRQLVGCLQLYTYNAGMYVVKESEITDSMYVIHTGKVKETCEEMDISARVYPAGSYFGIGLLRNTPYTHSYQTMIKSQVLTLNLDDWEYLLKHFPDSKAAIHKHMRQVGDKDMDQSNWPGGAPTEAETPEYEPLSEITDVPTGFDQFPGIERHFGRVSTVEGDDASLAPSLHGRKTFEWPTNSRGSEFGSRIKLEQDHLDDSKTELPHEAGQKQKFFKKFITTAKKIMGKVSDSDLGLAGEGKDDLLLEEDSEATETLLAQFEAAKKKAVEKSKKMKSRRKSMFRMQEEDTEKHMLTLDITESKGDDEKGEAQLLMMRPLRINENEAQESESQPFMMEPQLHDLDEEIDSASTMNTKETLNLGRPRTQLDKETSEVELANTAIADETTKAPIRSGSFTRPQQKLFYPGALVAQDTDHNQPVETTDRNRTAEDTQDTRSTEDVTVSETTKSFDPSKSFDDGTEAAQDITDSQPIQDTTDSLPTRGLTTIQIDQATQDTLVAQDTLESHPTHDTTDSLPIRGTSTAQIDQDAQDILATQDTSQPAQDTSDGLPTREKTATQIDQDAQDTVATQDAMDSQPAEDAKDTTLIDEDAQYTLVTQETMRSLPIQDMTDNQPTQETISTELGRDLQDTLAKQDTEGGHLTRGTPNAQVNAQDIQSARDAVTTEAPELARKDEKFQYSGPTIDTETAQDTTDIQGAKDDALKSLRLPSKSESELSSESSESSIDIAAASTGAPTSEVSAKTTASDEKHKSSLERTPITYDPELVGPPDTSVPEPAKEITKDAEGMAPTGDLKDEGTGTEASKLNRKFIKVRYDKGGDEGEDVTDEEMEDTDVDPSAKTPVPKRTEESNEGDDEATTSTSTSESPTTPKKGKPYYRRDSDE